MPVPAKRAFVLPERLESHQSSTENLNFGPLVIASERDIDPETEKNPLSIPAA